MTELLNGAPVAPVPLLARPAPDAERPLGMPHHVRWRRGSTRPVTVRRAVGLARYAVGTGLDPALHQFDATVRAASEQAARRVLDRAARRNRRRARRCDALADRADALVAQAHAQVTDVPVPDPVLRSAPASEVIAAHRRDGAAIAAIIESGGERPRRTRRVDRFVARALPWLDALLFGWFVSGVTNASLAAPLSTPVASAVTLGLTLLVVLVVASFTPWLGRSLRVVKGDTGEPEWARVGASSAALLGLWLVLSVALAATMFVRVRTEAAYAGADTPTAVAVGVLLSLAAFTLTVYVLALGFRDGIGRTDDLDARGRTAARQQRRSARRTARASALIRRRARTARRAAATEAAAVARARGLLERGERLLVLGRMRTGVTRAPAAVGARLDLTDLEAARRV